MESLVAAGLAAVVTSATLMVRGATHRYVREVEVLGAHA